MEEKKSNGFAIASLVLGIVSLVFNFFALQVFGLILVIAIIAFSIVYASKEKEEDGENTIDTSSQVANNTQDTNIISEENVVDDKKYEDVDIPEKLGGYDVMGQLVIEKIRCKAKCFK